MRNSEPPITPVRKVTRFSSRRSISGCGWRSECQTYAASRARPASSAPAASGTLTRCRPRVEKPNMASASPLAESENPRQSSGFTGCFSSGMKRQASQMPSRPIGMLIRKIQRQSA